MGVLLWGKRERRAIPPTGPVQSPAGETGGNIHGKTFLAHGEPLEILNFQSILTVNTKNLNRNNNY